MSDIAADVATVRYALERAVVQRFLRGFVPGLSAGPDAPPVGALREMLTARLSGEQPTPDTGGLP